jgi:alkylation response protein AidB-like acyl-CoA dehydrogenase
MSLTTEQQTLQATATKLADDVFGPSAGATDRERRFPADNLKALGEAGLLGLLVPAAYGGRGGSLSDLAIVEMELGRGCASTAMCFLMHCCGTALIASKATATQGQAWLRPAASGASLATLAFSERGTGAHFYAPELSVQRQDGGLRLSGRKSFITNGGHADFYPVLVNAPDGSGLDIYVLTRDMAGVSFEGEWDGVGMAGNSSINGVFTNVQIPETNRLGAQGDGRDLVFSVVAPTFLAGLAAVNVGISQAALDAAAEHAKTRKYATGQALADVPTIQEKLANMSIATESSRQLVLAAAAAADAGEATALPLLIEAKVGATDAAQFVTDTAMQVGGGLAYSRALPLERHWRDARAGSVMAPTNEVLREWLGKLLTGLPLF